MITRTYHGPSGESLSSREERPPLLPPTLGSQVKQVKQGQVWAFLAEPILQVI